MEDVLQFLLVAGILAFGIFKQFNKEKAKKKEKGSHTPAPAEYNYEPEFEETVLFEETQRLRTTPPKPAPPQEGIRSTYVPTTRPKTIKKAEVIRNEFSIQSMKEARRAIIWSEILRRKY